MTLLTQAELQQLLTLDPSTGHLTWKPRGIPNWDSRYAGTRAFTAINHYGYRVGAINNQLFRACRIIFVMLHGYEPVQVDHIDGNKLNDAENNLREVSSRENQQNMKRSKANTSGVTGVTWDKSKQRWMAHIVVQRKQILLGRFKDMADAVTARKQAEIDHGFHPNHGR